MTTAERATALSGEWVAYAQAGITDDRGDFMVAFVERDTPGYWPTTYTFASLEHATACADAINEARGISRSQALDVVGSSLAMSRIA